MARKNIPNFLMFDNIGLDQNRTSQQTSVINTDNIGLLISWAGTSPVGTVVIEVCNDGNKDNGTSGSWVALDFGSTITISGNSGDHKVTINQLPYGFIRARYVRTSGTGTMTISLTSKQLGA